MSAAPVYNHLTIFREPQRDAFLSETRAGDAYRDERLKTWIVTNPELCKAVLSAKGIASAPAVETYQNMAGGFSAQFENLSFAFDNIPLCLHGQPHAVSRRDMSTFIATRREALAAWMAGGMRDHLRPLLQPGRVEVMSEVVTPLVRALISTLIGSSLPEDINLDDVSLIFDKSISMQRRHRLEADIGRLRQHLKTTLGPEVSDEELGMRLALLILGKDASLGTLGESLYAVLHGSAGLPLDAIDYPTSPPRTGVPFVERIVVEPTTIGDWALQPGERIRVFLQTFTHDGPEAHHRLFGAGMHACLGRPLSTDLWKAITAQLATVPLTCRVLTFELATDGYVFNVPKRFELELLS